MARKDNSRDWRQFSAERDGKTFTASYLVEGGAS
jgi:hypothetical protein